MEIQRFETDVRFECPVCGKYAETSAEVPEPNWGAAEKMSDLTSEDQTEVVCNHCKTAFSAYVYNSSSSCDVTLDEHPDTVVDADMAFFSPPDEDWTETDIPANPYDVFMQSYHHTGDILADHGGDDGSHLINRMVFAQQVGAMEAYLGDTLKNRVNEKPEAMLRLLEADKELAKQRFGLAEIAAKPEIVSEAVAQYLRSILYHNLPKVDFLYRTALEVTVLRSDADKAKLMKAINYRHDCIHRNGFDKDGAQLTKFTKAYVQETADLIKSLVEQIEEDVYGPYPF
ncbi:hypothetical protein GR183_00040 [Stappia sp. GBMRC 2046]|uniref:RiboL-PSP-HEPN domain-containing protein n=1 Tax=Stappia sediminis TaxID=2692190 RepID=A0A7X3IZB7_9HYPH|nr:hypothetical protein [Stappia sediminis]MXN63278.1 hypothetical protein [Stappia sediminis]